MGFDDVPIGAVRDWLLAVTDFTVREHTARLVYAHPYGAERFFPTLHTWLDNASDLQKEGRFRWYTMTELSRFLTQREAVRWIMVRTSTGKTVLRAWHPNTLAHQTWAFPEGYYRAARVVDGDATVRVQDGMIFIVASEGHQLEVELNPKPESARPKTAAIEAKR
jgi:hypothetical protein